MRETLAYIRPLCGKMGDPSRALMESALLLLIRFNGLERPCPPQSEEAGLTSFAIMCGSRISTEDISTNCEI
jgi:hypothetical protein